MDRLIITPKWTAIKSLYKSKTNGSDKYGTNFKIGGKLDQMCEAFIEDLGAITRQFGYNKIVEGVPLNLWKERVWSLVENAGLLPEIAWRDEKAEAEIVDDWSSIEDEFDVEDPDEDEIYKELF